MIDRVVKHLRERAAVSEFAVASVTSRRAIRSARNSSFAERAAVAATVFYDDASGRGDATVVVQPHQLGELSKLIGGAIARAKHSRGPSWRLPAPAAPARVDVFDGSIAQDPVAAAFEISQRIASNLEPSGPLADAAGETLRASDATVDVEITATEVITSTGFHGTIDASRIRVTLTLSPKGEAPEAGTAAVVLDRRRREDLALDAELLAGAKRLRRRRRAKRIDGGVFDVALSARSIELAGPGYGWFAPLIAQADGTTARRGLARYLPGRSIFGDADTGGDPLTITSDGTLPFAPLSLPFSEHGAPVRRFAIVDAGRAAGLALDTREAALAGASPNGGVRNLVVAAGTLRTERKRVTENPLLRIASLASLRAEPQTGDFVAVVGLGSLEGEPVTGATLLGNIYSLFAGARLSAEIAQRGWYRGPAEIHFPGVRLV